MVDPFSNSENQEVEVWPAFTDLMLSTLLIFIFLVAGQLLTTSESIKWKIISVKQAQMEDGFKSNRLLSRYIEMNQLRIEVSGSLQKFTFSDELLFSSGEAELLEKGMIVLSEVGKSLNASHLLYERVDVQGHTDSIPIHNRKFHDNWELSTERALSVVRYLKDNFSIDPEKLSGSGFAEFRSIASNATEEGRKKNRRIEIVLEYSEQL